MRFSVDIMGGDEECDLESRIVYNACGVDIEEFMQNKKVLTREVFENNFSKVMKEVEQYAQYKFHIAYKVLGRFVLLTGASLPENIKELIIEATDWIYEKHIWSGDEIDERKGILKDLREKIERYESGIPCPIIEDAYY